MSFAGVDVLASEWHSCLIRNVLTRHGISLNVSDTQVPLPEITHVGRHVEMDLTEYVDTDVFGTVELHYTANGSMPVPGKKGTFLYTADTR